MDHEQKLVTTAILSIVALLIFGTIIFKFVENWSTVDAFYFTGVTMTTIGYGDITPHTSLGKILTVIFAFTSVSIALYSLNLLARRTFKQRLEHVDFLLKEKERKIDIVVKHK